MIHLIESRATSEQISEMMKTLEGYIKVAVDVRVGVLAGGGVMHVDCEEVLLEEGSKQQDVWGGDWYPEEKRVEFKSLINIRPGQGNPFMELKNEKIRRQMEIIIRNLLQR